MKDKDLMKENVKIKSDELKGWALSEYNEDSEEQLDYYINEHQCSVGDKAYLYSHENGRFTEMEIKHIISRMEDIESYEELLKNEDVLVDGEDSYMADTSAEFITDNDCYLVWFVYV